MLSLRKKKTVSNVSEALENHVKLINNNSNFTWVLVKYMHQDKRISWHSCKLSGNVVEIKDIAYFVGEDSLYYFNYKQNKESYMVSMVDIYEGITAGYNPFEDRLLRIYNEKLQKAIYLHLKTGIMEQKLKSKMTMRNIIVAGMLGIGAIFVIIKMFTG